MTQNNIMQNIKNKIISIFKIINETIQELRMLNLFKQKIKNIINKIKSL